MEEEFPLFKGSPLRDDSNFFPPNTLEELEQEQTLEELSGVATKKIKRMTSEQHVFKDLTNTPQQTQESEIITTLESEDYKFPDPNKLQKPKKPLTGYFIFLKEYKAMNKDFAPISAHKELSVIWNEMGKDQKQKYVTLAQEDQKRYQAEMEAYKAQIGESNTMEMSDEETSQVLVTVGKVKKIAKSDPEIRKIQKPTYEYIAKLTEAFGAFLLEEAEKRMKEEKKKKPGLNHLIAAARKNEALNFLDEAMIFQDPEALRLEKEKQNKIRIEKENNQFKEPRRSMSRKTEKADTDDTDPEKKKNIEKKSVERKKQVVPVKNNSKISDFFGKNNN